MIVAPFLFALFLLSLPILLPVVGLQQARTERRKRARVERSPCGWCITPLGAEALARADALFGACVDQTFGDMLHFRVVRDLDACCPHCNAGHRYDEQADRFVLLPARAFARTYGKVLETAVAPATAAMAWPFLPQRIATHAIALTRDGPGMDNAEDDDVDARLAGTLAVPAEVDVAAIGEALLRSPWLAQVGGGVNWTCAAGAVTLTFGIRQDMPFVHRAGPCPVRADSVTTVHLCCEGQHDPGRVGAATLSSAGDGRRLYADLAIMVVTKLGRFVLRVALYVMAFLLSLTAIGGAMLLLAKNGMIGR